MAASSTTVRRSRPAADCSAVEASVIVPCWAFCPAKSGWARRNAILATQSEARTTLSIALYSDVTPSNGRLAHATLETQGEFSKTGPNFLINSGQVIPFTVE